MRNGQFTMRKYMTFLALVCLMLSAACNISDPEISPSIEDGYGIIRINLAMGETAVRTVLPSLASFTKYEYTFTKAGETTGVDRIPGTDGSFLMELGNYTVAVKAYIGSAASYTLAANGTSSTFSVSEGDNPTVQVALNAAGTAQGSFTYTITYPEGIEDESVTAEITLKKWSNMEDVTLEPDDVTNGKTETLSLDAGYYLFTVKITEEGRWHAGISEAVHIYPSLSTVYTKIFSEADMIAE